MKQFLKLYLKTKTLFFNLTHIKIDGNFTIILNDFQS